MAEKRLTDHEKNVHGRDTGDVVMGRWQAKTLDELCKIARGGSPRPIKEYLTDAPGGVNWIKISDATASTKYIFRVPHANVCMVCGRGKLAMQ